MKTEAQKERRRRYLKKHPEFYIKQLKNWVAKEKDPAKLILAKEVLARHLPRPAADPPENKRHRTRRPATTKQAKTNNAKPPKKNSRA